MSQQPPKLFTRFFRWYCDPKLQDYIEGDLIEVYERRLGENGKRRADLMFMTDVMLLFRPGIIRSGPKNRYVNSSNMMHNYIKTGWRNLWRSKLHSFINITGLTFGITCFLLIGLYLFDELTFDQQHLRGDRIYRVVEHRNFQGQMTVIGAASYKLAEESPHAIPEVEKSTRFIRTGRANLVDPAKPVNVQETVTVADENFFQIFDFPFVEGDRRTALKEPNSIVITADLAMRIFGSIDVMGKNLQFSHMQDPLQITGILENHRRNSSFNFTSIMSESTYYSSEDFRQTMSSDWGSTSFAVYVLLKQGSDAEEVSRKMTELVLANTQLETGENQSFTLQPLNDLHLNSAEIFDGARNSNVDAIPKGNPLYIKVFSFVAVFVLLIAGINYTNLTTAKASGRVKEIGVRKAIGAMRNHLMSQFLLESLLTTTIAFALALIALLLLLPAFNQFTGKEITLGVISGYRYWVIAIALIIVIAFLSGSYAAFLLSRLKPSSLLKGLKIRSVGDHFVRKGLVVFQFTVSIVMIIATIAIFMQVNYLNNADLGFNKDLLVVIDVNTGRARSNFEAVKNQMANIPGVKNVSVSSRVPGEWKSIRRVKARTQGSTSELQIAYCIGADKDFLRTFEVRLLTGRNFQDDNDSTSILINEAAAKVLGITDLYGQSVEMPEIARNATFVPFDENGLFAPRVIGIVKDFHFQSLREKIQPLILAYNNNPIHVIDYYTVRIEPAGIKSTLEKLKEVMVKNDPDDPFEYHFLDEQLELFYVEDERRQTLLGWTAAASIFIACLGLFGLATYATEQRVKEIGVRKVLGASVAGLVSLLSRDFLKLVVLAGCIAFPISWWATNRWLQEYAYHIEVGWAVYLLAAVLAAGIALITISYQAFKASVSNPVNSLRSE